jgi:hypothetical protein
MFFVLFSNVVGFILWRKSQTAGQNDLYAKLDEGDKETLFDGTPDGLSAPPAIYI